MPDETDDGNRALRPRVLPLLRKRLCDSCGSGLCPDALTCEVRPCSAAKGLTHCHECPTPCQKGILSKIKPRGFTEFARRYGQEHLLDCLERNEAAGVALPMASPSHQIAVLQASAPIRTCAPDCAQHGRRTCPTAPEFNPTRSRAFEHEAAPDRRDAGRGRAQPRLLASPPRPGARNRGARNGDRRGEEQHEPRLRHDRPHELAGRAG